MAKTSNFDFTALFKDKNKFPDDLTFKVGDDEMTLGVLRAYNDNASGALVTELEKQKKDLRVEQEKVQKAASEVANMYVQLEDQRKKLKAEPVRQDKDPLEEFVDDPIAGQIAKQLKDFRDEVKRELTTIKDTELGKLNKAIAEMGVAYMNDRAQNEYESLADRNEYAPDLTLDSLYKYAVENNHVHKNRLPNLKKAYEELTAPKRQERAVKEAEERGMQKALDEQRKQAMMPRPGGVGQNGFERTKNSPKSLDEAIAAAAGDVSIWTGQGAN